MHGIRVMVLRWKLNYSLSLSLSFRCDMKKLIFYYFFLIQMEEESSYKEQKLSESFVLYRMNFKVNVTLRVRMTIKFVASNP